MFGKGNDFATKITYKTDGDDPRQLIRAFRNDYNPRIAVTVDMIATGTDVKPLECVIFMRDVRSELYFEQMKGRGARTITADDLRAGHPRRRGQDALRADRCGRRHREPEDRFAAAGARARGRLRQADRSRSPPGRRDDDAFSTLAARLAALDRRIDDKDRADIAKAPAASISWPRRRAARCHRSRQDRGRVRKMRRSRTRSDAVRAERGSLQRPSTTPRCGNSLKESRPRRNPYRHDFDRRGYLVGL